MFTTNYGSADETAINGRSPVWSPPVGVSGCVYLDGVEILREGYGKGKVNLNFTHVWNRGILAVSRLHFE
ncbi:MAG: hypothetical protein AB7G93_20220 [Bdellovibrionales bacterium]